MHTDDTRHHFAPDPDLICRVCGGRYLDSGHLPARIWPDRVTPETITPEQIRAFYTDGTWPEKMVYCDMLKIIGDLAIRNLEAIAEFERRSNRDKTLAEAQTGVVGFGAVAAFAACYRDAAKFLRQRPETEKCEGAPAAPPARDKKP